MHKSSPIGVFDSGVGGLSVVTELFRELPNESILYFADNKNAPYGNKAPGDVLDFAEDITEYMISEGAKLVVVACNTATGIAIHHLRKRYTIPFVGMEPAIKPAARITKTMKIGVLATANTFEASHFNKTKNRFANHVEVIMAVGDGLVELVEEGKADSLESEKLISRYLEPMVKRGIDQLVLGCTHYPFLIPVIKRVIPESIQIHDPAPAVAKQTKRILKKLDLLNDALNPSFTYTASGSDTVLKKMIEAFYLYQSE